MKDGLVLCPKIFSGLPANLVIQAVINDRFNRQDLEVLFR